MYVLMMADKTIEMPVMAYNDSRKTIEAEVTFDVFPVAVSDDPEPLLEYYATLCERFPTFVGYRVVNVPIIGSTGPWCELCTIGGELLRIAEDMEKTAADYSTWEVCEGPERSIEEEVRGFARRIREVMEGASK